MKLRGNPLLRSADWWAGVPAVRVAAARRLGRRAAVPHPPARIVVLKTAAIGDTVLLSGAVRDLRRAFPAATITLAVGGSNAQVARLVPEADAVVRVALGPSGVRMLRRLRPDLLIDFGSWPRIDALMAALSGARCVAGFQTEGQRRHAAFDIAIRHRPDVHELDNYRALVRAVGIEAGAEPRLALPETDAPPSEPPFAVVHMWPGGTRSELREWPQARWSELVGILRDVDLEVVVTGAPSDGPRIEEFLARTACAGVRAAYGMDFPSTAALLARSRLVVSVNTGVMHAAAVLGVPVVGLCGPTSAVRWGPVGERAAAVSSRLPGCGFLNLGFEYDGRREDCMAGIALDDVLEAAERVSGLDIR